MSRFVFKLPDVGEGVAEAEVVAWHVAPGQAVEEDQPLVDVMTDKATVEITAPVSGKVQAIYGEPGSRLAIGADLAVFELAREAAPAAEVTSPAPPPDAVRPTVAPMSSKPPPSVTAPAAPPAPVIAAPIGAKPLAAPSVRRRALDLGVPLQFVRGSGPAGRVSHADLDAHVAAGPSAAANTVRADEVTEVKVIGLRRRIADKMSLSKRSIAHFSYVEEADVTELEALRAHLNAVHDMTRPKLTMLPLFIKAMIAALADFPQMNALFDDEAGVVRRHSAVHMGVAVQTPGGLMVPVIRHAEAMGLWDLAEQIARLAEAARKGTAQASQLSGSTITVTSLGPLGGLSHTPVINHPEVAIVGPNRVAERPVVRHGAVAVRTMMNVSSSFDHRVVDGHDAARFIQRLKGLLEHPGAIFAE